MGMRKREERKEKEGKKMKGRKGKEGVCVCEGGRGRGRKGM